MKRALVLALLCVVGLTLTSGATFLVGIEMAPYFVPEDYPDFEPPPIASYFVVGYDSGWLVSSVGVGFPLTLTVEDVGKLTLTSYTVTAGPAFHLTSEVRVGGGLAYWLDVVSVTIQSPPLTLHMTEGRWTGWIGLDWEVAQMTVGDWEIGCSLFTRAHFPFPLHTHVPYGGMHFTLGIVLRVSVSPTVIG